MRANVAYNVNFTTKNLNMYKGFLHTHYLVVTIFLFLYVIKTILLLSDKTALLENFSKKTRVFEMIVSSLFLITGIYLVTQLPFGGKYDYLFYIKIGMVIVSIPLAIVGFKRGNKLLAALSLLLITGSFGLAEVYSKRKAVPRDSTTPIASNDGKALYINNCGLCHGDNGKLGISGAKDLSVTEMDLTSMVDIIVHGKGNMPPARVNDAEAMAIAEYVDQNIKAH
jgi:mono/diheme cytochrome c family protein